LTQTPKGAGGDLSLLACLDVDYRDAGAVAACLTFEDWLAGEPLAELTEWIAEVAPYVSGQFYRRELPCLLQVLARLESLPEVVIIDGYVWLGDESKPGLGAHLHEALDRNVPIIGVAKTHLRGAGPIKPIRRGKSELPLFVSATGIALDEAVDRIQAMHGAFRLPTLLKSVDRLCRQGRP